MPRDLRHFLLADLGQSQAFQAKGGGSKAGPSAVPNRAAHAQALLTALDALPDVAVDHLPGLYLSVAGRPGEPMITSGLDASGLTLINFKPGAPQQNLPGEATVFATPEGLEKLRKKIDEFENKDRIKQGKLPKPYNANLVQSIDAIVEAGLKALW